MTLATPVPYDSLFDDGVDKPKEPALGSLTPREHLRAFLRWWSPVLPDTREYLAFITVAYSVIAVVAAVLQSWDTVWALWSLYWLGFRVYLAWRLVMNLTVLALGRLLGGKSDHAVRRAAWQASAREPLFPFFWKDQARRQRCRRGAKWLRTQGWSRRRARRAARGY